MEYLLEERPKFNDCQLGVQSFSSEEWCFLSGASSSRLGIRAIPLSVFSYELSMLGIAQSLVHDTKPFLTYLREDDTYQSLMDRILLYTDEANWDRMALVSRNLRQVHLPIETIPSPVEEMEEETQPQEDAEELGIETEGGWLRRSEEKSDHWYCLSPMLVSLLPPDHVCHSVGILMTMILIL
jgi:hypothetical protein